LQDLAIALAIPNTDQAQKILTLFNHQVDVDDSLSVIARIWLAQKKIHDYSLLLLESQPIAPVLTVDWQATLEAMYARKRRSQPLPEGDPARFRAVAKTLTSTAS
jgi:phycocyanobilin lyase subunit beta